MQNAAQQYLDASLCVLPAKRAEKRPAIGAWKVYQDRLPTEAELSAWMANNPDAVCLICGEASQNLEMLDFDQGGALFDQWKKSIPPELLKRLVIERSQSGGFHVIYCCAEPVCGNLKLAQRRIDGKLKTLIETRGEGGLFLCAPTPGYEIVRGDLAKPPVITAGERDILLSAAWELNEVESPTDSPSGESCNTGRPGDDYNERGEVREVLQRHGWALEKPGENEHWRRPGKERGSSATLKDRVFYVFSSNADPFEPGKGYSFFSVYALLEHDGDFEQAARALREEGYGSDDVDHGVDISAILAQFAPAEPGEKEHVAEDPGPFPEHLFRMPGFVERVMDFSLDKAPYPNVALAFCGAVAMQSYLAGRKVCDPSDLRTNIYLLALAGSGTGKDFPRKVNNRIMLEIGHIQALGDKFASGEGIQDALSRNQAMLFQNDEMDGVLRQINGDRDGMRESIPNILLTLYSSADNVYPLRVKAGQKDAESIDQPHMTLFGTATPQFFYESLSQRMLTNGFFSRMIIVDVDQERHGQSEPGPARLVPEDIIQTARWWAEFQPGTRKTNLIDLHPEPRTVAYTKEAGEAIAELRQRADNYSNEASRKGDEITRVAWSRTCENAKKLALIYACSQNHEMPCIGTDAVEWAATFAIHQTKRMLHLASLHVAENPFHKECLKLKRVLKKAGGQMARNKLMRAMRVKAADFDQIVQTMIQQGDIEPADIPTRTKTAHGYRLI